ncbi:hypothetical protein K488DRAFT_87122 [Vararia minispora EC-137]|uniref:Uncharacterized protein n=1 Tax=Vararia minispora EC-137 TaxID=1314806 RepID=A0ACB8QH32_9AGAM|nr:hypothetical protein K488DRAFT_87122 [Vararia minispora EC-137]
MTRICRSNGFYHSTAWRKQEFSVGVKALELYKLPAIPVDHLTLYWTWSTAEGLHNQLQQHDLANVFPVHSSVPTVHICSRALVWTGTYDFNEPALNLALQHELVTLALQLAFPSATQFAFCEQIAWRRDDERRGWYPAVLLPYATRIEPLLRPGGYGDEGWNREARANVDWNGHLLRLFENDMDLEMTPEPRHSLVPG